MQLNSVSERLIFNNAVRALRKAGISTGTARPLQSYLRLEQALSTSKSNYTFNITNSINQGQPFNTEKRLNLQDSFVVSAIQFAVGLPSSATDATFRKLTYLNPFIFADATAMGVVYNGLLTLQVDNNVYLPAWDLERHLFIPETQQSAAVPAAGSTLDEYDGSAQGYFPVEPNIVLIGSKNLNLQVTLPDVPSAVTANSRMIITLRGILAQNSTSVK